MLQLEFERQEINGKVYEIDYLVNKETGKRREVFREEISI